MGRHAGAHGRRILTSVTATAAAVVAGGVAPLLLASPASALVPQPGSDGAERSPASSGQAAVAARLTPVELLERRVRQRERALASIQHRAAQYADQVEERAAQVAALGYTGDLDDLSVVLPLAGYRLTAHFGQGGDLWSSDHTGLDFAAPTGTPLVAVASGTVTTVDDAGAYGLRTILTLDDGTEIWYCHQVAALVEPGQRVEVAEPLGLVGSTGNSTGPHLHLEVRPLDQAPVDPALWFEAAGLQP